MEKLVNLIPLDVLLTAAIGAVVAYLMPTLLGVKAKVEETEKEVAELYSLVKGLVLYSVEAIEDGKLTDNEKEVAKQKLNDIVNSAKEVLK